MLNKWWFRLYTKGFLLELVKVILVCIVVDQGMTHLAGTYAMFACLVAAGPFALLVMKNTNGSLRGNIEFHKMSVPFTELKGALIKDILISMVATIAASLLIIGCSYYLDGIYSTKVGTGIFRMITPGMFIFYAAMAFLCGCYIMIVNKDRKYLLVDKSPSRFRNFINTAYTSVIGLFFSIGIMVLVSSPQVGSILVPVTIFVGALFFHQKAIFNQYRHKGRVRDFAIFWGMGTAVCCSLYFACLLVSRQDVLNENLHPLQRVSSFEFNGRYNPSIDVETFKDLERHMRWASKHDLYANLEFDPSTLGLDFYLDNDKNGERLTDLLSFTKPTPEFLLALYDHFEKNPTYWKEKSNFSNIQHMAFSRWPKKHTLPEKYIVAKQTSFELFKKDKALAKAKYQAKLKARREMASKREAEEN